MLDNPPAKLPKTAQVIASPPRRQAKPADPCAMVIFGASGDLTKRLVVPALYARFRSRQESTFGEKVLSAMRLGFGGHVEGHEPIEPEARLTGSQNSPPSAHAAE